MAQDVDYPDREVSAYFAHWRYAKLALPLRTRARELGYNLITHGSLARDIDLVAVPWTDAAVAAEDLVREVMATCDGLLDQPTYVIHEPSQKPHGRRAWSIDVGGTYLDLSVMPLSPSPAGLW